MPRLAVRDLAFEAGGRTLLRSIHLDVRAGELVAIVGPNGAGKSTLLRLIAGTLRGTGAVLVDETSLASLSRRARARTVAFIPADDSESGDLTVREVVSEGRHAHRRGPFDTAPAHERIVDDALARVGLGGFADRSLTTLSSGERRRAWIALGLAQQAPVMLFDEPTAHLDFRYAQETLRLMRDLARGERAIVTVLHDLNEAAQIADRIALVDGGRLVDFGAPSDVLTREQIIRCYGVTTEIIRMPDASIRIFARA